MKHVLVLMLVGTLAMAGCASTDEEEMADAAGMAGAGASGTVPGAGAAAGMPGVGGFDQRPLEPMEAARELVEVGDRVFFAFDSYDLDSEARLTLERQAALLRPQPRLRIVIEGHADERGTREYNLALGERRANAVRDYLIALGIDPARIRTVSYGDERPAVVGTGEDVWAQNRRGVTVITGAPGA